MEPPIRIVEGRVLLPTGTWGVMPDVHRELRGYDFYPSFAVLARIPATGITEIPAAERILHLHFGIPDERFDWYVAELDPATGRAFGWLRSGGLHGEWGHFILGDLEECVLDAQALRLRSTGSHPQIIHRDRAFRPAPAAHCLPAPTI